jgi:hypothetical protein
MMRFWNRLSTTAHIALACALSLAAAARAGNAIQSAVNSGVCREVDDQLDPNTPPFSLVAGMNDPQTVFKDAGSPKLCLKLCTAGAADCLQYTLRAYSCNKSEVTDEHKYALLNCAGQPKGARAECRSEADDKLKHDLTLLLAERQSALDNCFVWLQGIPGVGTAKSCIASCTPPPPPP